MIPIKNAKDIVLINYVNSTVRSLTMMAVRRKPDEITALVDMIYCSYYVPVKTSYFDYRTLIEHNVQGGLDDLIRKCHTVFRKSVREFNEQISENSFLGFPDYVNSEYSKAVVKVLSENGEFKEYDQKGTEIRCQVKMTEGWNTDIVFNDEIKYYSIETAGAEGGAGDNIGIFPVDVPPIVPF